jgi:hypothetical protein
VTYAKVPAGFTATPNGLDPTGIVAETVLLPRLITDTELLELFVTYAKVPAGFTATLRG